MIVGTLTAEACFEKKKVATKKNKQTKRRDSEFVDTRHKTLYRHHDTNCTVSECIQDHMKTLVGTVCSCSFTAR